MAFDIKFDLHQLTVDASKKLQLSRCFSGWGSSRCSFSGRCRSSFSSWSWSRSSFGGDSAAVNYSASTAFATGRNNFASWSATAASLSSAACLQASQQTLRAAWWASFFAYGSWFAANWSWFTYRSWFASGFANRSSTAALLSSHLGAKTCQKTWLAATTWIWFANWLAYRSWFANRSWFASWFACISSATASVLQAS